MLNEATLRKIAKDYPSPAFIFDKDELAKRIGEMNAILGEGVELCYAMKANPFLVDTMKKLVNKFEVCSPGEFEICGKENVDMSAIVLSGVNKEETDIDRVMNDFGGVGVYTIESLKHLQVLDTCSKRNNMKIKALIRLTSGNQFGMDEETIEAIIANADKYENIEFLGLQCYTGTQKKKMSIIEEELKHMDEFCDELKQKYGFVAKELEYGPGLPISYFEPDVHSNSYELLEELAVILKPLKSKYAITLEMGRYIAATCGYYYTSVMDIKSNKGQNYLIVDGGINHVNYYGQTMAMKIPQIMHYKKDDRVSGNAQKWNVCGSLCTVGDVLVKNLELTGVSEGDLLVFCNIGAYSVTEGIYLFLSRNMPKILAYSEKDGVEVLRDVRCSYILNSRKDLLD